MQLAFTIIALLILAGATAAVALRNLVHCVLCLAVAFVGVAALFLLLGAEFVGLAQIMVYVGAVAILMVFALLLTRNADLPATGPLVSKSWLTGVSIAALVFGCLAICILASGVGQAAPLSPQLSVRQIGEKLMQDCVLPLEVLGVLLTVSMIGAVVIAMTDPKPD